MGLGRALGDFALPRDCKDAARILTILAPGSATLDRDLSAAQVGHGAGLQDAPSAIAAEQADHAQRQA